MTHLRQLMLDERMNFSVETILRTPCASLPFTTDDGQPAKMRCQQFLIFHYGSLSSYSRRTSICSPSQSAGVPARPQ